MLSSLLSGHQKLEPGIDAAGNLQTQLLRTQSNANDLMDDETVYDEASQHLKDDDTTPQKTTNGTPVPKPRDQEGSGPVVLYWVSEQISLEELDII